MKFKLHIKYLRVCEQSFTENLSLPKFKFDIIGITETKVKDDLKPNEKVKGNCAKLTAIGR